MQLVLIRHGIAEDRAAFAKSGHDDSKRPLTKQGRWKMEKVVRGLRHAVPGLDMLATSPFTRAVQTADIVAAAYKGCRVTEVDALVPDSPLPAFLSWIRKQRGAGVIAAVGHEPHLSTLASWLLAGVEHSVVDLKKGGVCTIDFDRAPEAGGGRLAWAMTPALLRRLTD